MRELGNSFNKNNYKEVSGERVAKNPNGQPLEDSSTTREVDSKVTTTSDIPLAASPSGAKLDQRDSIDYTTSTDTDAVTAYADYMREWEKLPPDLKESVVKDSPDGRMVKDGGKNPKVVDESNDAYDELKAEQPSRRQRGTIQAEMDTIEDRYTQVLEQNQDSFTDYDDLPSEQSDLIMACAQGEISKEEAQAKLPTSIHGVLEGMISILSKVKELDDYNEDLKKEMLPYWREDINEELGDILGRIDYDAMFRYTRDIFSEDDIDQLGSLGNQVGGVMLVTKVQQQIAQGTLDYQTAEYAKDVIPEYKERWNARGFLKDEASDFAVDEEYSEDDMRNTLEKGESAVDTISAYRRLASAYKLKQLADTDYIDLGLADAVSGLSPDALRNKGDDYDEYGIDPRFIAAGVRHIEALIEEHQLAGRLPKTEAMKAAERERIAAIDLATITDAIDFENFEAPEGMVCVLDPQELRAKLLAFAPPDFLQKLKGVKHLPEGGHLDGSIRTIGELTPELGSGEEADKVVSTYIRLYEDLFVPADAFAGDISARKENAEDTFWHEYGHNAHYMLDYEEMLEWETIVDNDPTIMDWNTGNKRGTLTEKIEDFADSMKNFHKRPAVQLEFSEARYNFMLQYHLNHLHPDQREGFLAKHNAQIADSQAFWEKVGISREGLKKFYDIVEPGDTFDRGVEITDDSRYDRTQYNTRPNVIFTFGTSDKELQAA